MLFRPLSPPGEVNSGPPWAGILFLPFMVKQLNFSLPNRISSFLDLRPEDSHHRLDGINKGNVASRIISNAVAFNKIKIQGEILQGSILQ